jgi:hypothetical protein
MNLHEIWQNFLDLEYSGKLGFNVFIYLIIIGGCISTFQIFFRSYKWYEKYKYSIRIIEKRFPQIESENLMATPLIIAIILFYHFLNLDDTLFYFVSEITTEIIPSFWRNLI